MRNDYGSGYLAHHGILGMKWGIRRYQNPDGTLTAAGRRRYYGYAKKVIKISNLKKKSNDAKIAAAKYSNKTKRRVLKDLKNPELEGLSEKTKAMQKKNADKQLKYDARAKKYESRAEKLIAKSLSKYGHISEYELDAQVHKGNARLQQLLAKGTDLDIKIKKQGQKNKERNALVENSEVKTKEIQRLKNKSEKDYDKWISDLAKKYDSTSEAELKKFGKQARSSVLKSDKEVAQYRKAFSDWDKTNDYWNKVLKLSTIPSRIECVDDIIYFIGSNNAPKEIYILKPLYKVKIGD